MRRGKERAERLDLRAPSMPRGESLRVVIDACVWHGAFARNVLRHLALRRLVELRWTTRIEDEWIRSIHRVRPDLPLAKLREVRDRFRRDFPEGLVRASPASRTYRNPSWTAAMSRLPDPDDAHVVRAALRSGSKWICTVDRRGFPEALLRPLGIMPIHPDELVHSIFLQRPDAARLAVETHREALRAPALSREEYAGAMHRSGLPQSARATLALTAPGPPSRTPPQARPS